VCDDEVDLKCLASPLVTPGTYSARKTKPPNTGMAWIQNLDRGEKGHGHGSCVGDVSLAAISMW